MQFRNRLAPLVFACGLLVACDSSKSSELAGTGGAGGTVTGSGGAAEGVGGRSGGASDGLGGASGGTGGTSSIAAEALIACSDGDYAGIANPADFSLNTDSHVADHHTLAMTAGDVIRRVVQYTTSGPADHKHLVVFTDDQLVMLLAGHSVTATTSGPPLNASTGHSHTVTVSACIVK